MLQELDISFPKCITDVSSSDDCNNAIQVLTQKLPELRKVNLSANSYVNNSLFFQLCRNCEFLQQVVMFECPFITHVGIASAIFQRPSLRFLSFNKFKEARKKKNVISYFIDSLSSLKHLTHLDLSFSRITNHLFFSLANQALPLKNLVLQGCCGYAYTGISYFLSQSRFLQHLNLQNTEFLNDHIFSELCVFLVNLVSINVCGFRKLTNSALFAILRNSPLLSEIRMESTGIGIGAIPWLDLVVYNQLKSLHLAYNSYLRDEVIYMFAFMFPNMQLLDLSFCCGISEDIISELLKKCPKIRRLNLAFCLQPKLFLIDFEVPKLEVLNLSHSRINDEVLYAISNFCHQLQKLDLECCYGITEKGVRLLVEKCTHLREINLRYCCELSTNFVAWMIFSRPSLRKIMAPPHFRACDDDGKLLFRRCLVC